MISCNKCKNSISRNMKHSLKSNECPFCGNSLLNNEDLKKCKSISYDLLSAGFRESEVYDMSVFIYNKYIKNLDKPEETEILSDEEYEGHDSFNEEVDNDFSENKFSSDLDEIISEDEDEDDKVSRLRKLAKSNPILNKKGASVRRVSEPW